MNRRFLIGVLACMALTACGMLENDRDIVPESDATPIQIGGEIYQAYVTRASDKGFANGDEIGIYVVDYDGTTPGELTPTGTRASNLRFTFDEANWKWIPDHDIYYKDKNTHIDVYGYYPYSSPESIEAYAFEVQKDQTTEGGNGKMGGYEASDFLWGKAADVAPSDRTISVSFHHQMASAKVTLVQGTGFDSAEWASLEKSVVTESAIRTSTINLKTGEVKVTGTRPTTGTIAYRSGSDWRCILVPQTIAAGDALFSLSVGGLPYSLRKGEDFTFTAGKLHNFTITVNKRSDTGTYEFVLSGESITPWENDPVSHDAVAREYVIVNVPEAGTLAEQITASGKDLAQVRNLKVTGKINNVDFCVMREEMVSLQSLNLKEVRIVEGTGTYYHNNWIAPNDANQIPGQAMSNKTSLLHLVLPDMLTYIGEGAFNHCNNLTGSLVIPEGVTEIGDHAFYECTNMAGSLYLPTTLKIIGVNAFNSSGFTCELKFPESVEVIKEGAFNNCRGFYGELHLPSHLKELGSSAFRDITGISGSIEIPQTLTIIPDFAFYTYYSEESQLHGTLKLHDGITSIGRCAFTNTGLRGELVLPKELVIISEECFAGCDFNGTLMIPENVAVIGRNAFERNWRLMGTITIPQNVQSIGEKAFAYCRSLEGVIFEDGVETIGKNAFEMCTGIGSIVCKSSVPPYLQSGAFDGVPKDNFTVEVPEAAIAAYQTEPGWSDFKRISVYRNLIIRPSMATAINTSVTRDLVLNADDDWVVESQPDWVTLDQTSGAGKTALKLTFAQMPAGSAPRESEVVFKLKDKDYRTRCKVTQYNYSYAEDEIITLNASSKGNNNNLIILGDGFDAKDISEGKLLATAQEAYDHFFDIEPYKTYKEYFNVYTAISVSPESGIGSVNRIVYNRFNTKAAGGGVNNADDDWNEIMKYACKAPTVNENNLGGTLVIMIPNTKEYAGTCYMFDDGFAVAYCPMSDYGYPLDFRGVVQHEAGGHGFGKLGDEYIYHNEFIDGCPCTCCSHNFELAAIKSKGWFRNLSLTGKMSEVDWNHLIFHPKYSGIVDVFEGGYMHTRSVYRSEQNSCMNNDIPYYSTISRQAMVERIKTLAGEAFDFDDFVAKDVIVAKEELTTKALDYQTKYLPMGQMHAHPQLMGERPAIKW
jgi:hypothetical protein